MKKRPSEKYLDKCLQRAHSADPYHYDAVINDLRRRINRLVKYIRSSKTKS